jgi:hydroxyacylglutathione hydrolase
MLPDEVEVHPAHGAGSLCGSGIGSEPHSTIGQERRFNALLQHRSKEAFVEAVLRDLPETPPYFAELKRINQHGPATFGLANALPDTPPLSPLDAERAVRGGAVLVDIRQPEAFADGHAAGAINIGFGMKVGYWAGWVVPLSSSVVLCAEEDSRQIGEVRRQLLRVGIDRVEGYVNGGFASWRDAGLPLSRYTRMSARELHDRVSQGQSLTLVDVRTRHEFEGGHIPGALSIPVGSLLTRATEIPRHLPVATICEAGYRSALAASLLARAGISPILNIAGGMTAYRAVETTAASEL